MNEQEVIEAIKEYQGYVAKGNSLLVDKYDLEVSPFKAFKRKLISKSGILDLEKNISYSFHGVGCSVIFGETKVDFDYGPNQRIDGFDFWRLYEFIKTSNKSYNHLLLTLEENFKNLEHKGIIECPEWLPSKHLYYFSEAITSPN